MVVKYLQHCTCGNTRSSGLTWHRAAWFPFWDSFFLSFSHALPSWLLLFYQRFVIKQFFRCDNTEIRAKCLGTRAGQTLVAESDTRCLGSSLSPSSTDFPHPPTKFPTGGFSISLSTRNPPFPFEEHCLKSCPSFATMIKFLDFRPAH